MSDGLVRSTLVNRGKMPRWRLPRQLVCMRTGAAAELPALFGSVRVSRSPDGGLRLDAPPEAAATLAGLLAGMARLFEQVASDDTGPRPGAGAR